MYKLIRFYNQNRRKIIIIVLVIIFLLLLLQLFNYLAKTNQSVENKNIKNQENIQNNNEMISNKSAVSGKDISQTKLKNDSDIINEFFEYCNNGDIEKAYNILTDECKEEIYSSIENFKNNYYDYVFKGEKKSYTIENWTDNVYQVRITDDILSTGKLDTTETRQDYVSVVDDKLNINSYIKRTKLNKETIANDVKITVNQIDTYMDYEIYSLTIENNSNKTIKLDTNDDTKSVYLLDNNDHKYYFYNNEINENKLIISSKFKNTLKIKFMSSYGSTKKIQNLVFSKMILDFDDYKNSENKEQFKDFYNFKVNI